jgi:hypothetical protein
LRSRAAAKILFFVRSGTEREAEELFRTAETVLAVSPTHSATDFSVAAAFLPRSPFFVCGFIPKTISVSVLPFAPTLGPFCIAQIASRGRLKNAKPLDVTIPPQNIDISLYFFLDNERCLGINLSCRVE